MDKEIRKLVKQLRREGFKVGRGGSDHLIVTNGNGRRVCSFAATPRQPDYEVRTVRAKVKQYKRGT